jgi:hypothetical protein
MACSTAYASVTAIPYFFLSNLQKTLDKFEYLPVKCKVIVGQENWKKYSDDVENIYRDNRPPLKTKV